MSINKAEGDKGNTKEVILNVHIHCEGCASKVRNCLKGFDGVENIVIDGDKVTLNGKKMDAKKILERLQKKYSKNVELISPKLKPEKEQKEQKKEEPKKKTVVLKMNVHCEGCARDIKKDILAMEGITVVEVEMDKSLVNIKGNFDPEKLVKKIKKQLGRHAEIVKQGSEQEGKPKDQQQKKKGNNNDQGIHFPSQNHVNNAKDSPCFHNTRIFSDDNIFACVIM